MGLLLFTQLRWKKACKLIRSIVSYNTYCITVKHIIITFILLNKKIIHFIKKKFFFNLL